MLLESDNMKCSWIFFFWNFFQFWIKMELNQIKILTNNCCRTVLTPSSSLIFESLLKLSNIALKNLILKINIFIIFSIKIFSTLFINFFYSSLFKICTEDPNTDGLLELLKILGMIPLESGLFKLSSDSKKSKVYFYDIVLNGQLLGYIGSTEIDAFQAKLRYLKALSTTEKASEHPLCQSIPKFLEICHVPKPDLANCSYSLYPALYLFSSPGRMMRPVKNLTTNETEYIGSMEQCYLHVVVKPEEFVETVCVPYFRFKLTFNLTTNLILE